MPASIGIGLHARLLDGRDARKAAMLHRRVPV